MVQGRAWWALLACVFLGVGTARAQYRNNGLLVEGGVETLENVPLTLGMMAGTQVVHTSWQRLHKRGDVGPVPSGFVPCLDRISHGMDGPPCRNNWYQMMDAPTLEVGYQRVVGDLLMDVTESPLIKSIVVSARSGLAASFTPPFMGVFRPIGMMHNEVGLRWNASDERWRPFLGVSVGVNLMLDPVGAFLRTRTMVETCRKVDAGEPLAPDETCIRDGGIQVPGTESRVNPELVLFAANTLPVLFDLRPEGGLEYFFAEDVSVQFHASVAAFASPVPAFLMRPPFVNLSARVGASLVAYF